MDRKSWIGTIIMFLVIFLFLFAFGSSAISERKRIREEHKRKLDLCMKAGHEQLWCEGLLK